MIQIDKEFKDLIPALTKEEYEQLEANILAEGVRDSLLVWNGVLIDGHNRYEIATKHGIPFDVQEKEFADRAEAERWIILNQFGRRNLSAYDRSVLALKLKPIVEAKAKENQKLSDGRGKKGCQKSDNLKDNSQQSLQISTSHNSKTITPKSARTSIDTKKEIAKVAGVSHDTIAKVEKIQKQATPEIKKAVKSGEMSINQAYNAIKNEERKEAIQKQIEDIEHEVMVKPDGLFDVIAIDPPWNYGTQFSASGRRVANPYPEMTQEQLKTIEIPASDNCVMFLWTTHKFIWDAKELLDTWGFEYRSMLVWDKQKIGMGDLLRMQCEFCLIGIKGKPVFRDNHSIRDIIAEPRREHSRKPDGFYQLVNDLCVGRKLDYFSRETREGWVSYGNDTDKFN
jgi:N6-adenosine-specific RNA methylase IME4/DNA-binding XRE family transcriptional regulator